MTELPAPAPGLPGNPYPAVDVDLDELVSETRTVRFAGDVWTIPGDMPLEVYLLMQRAAGVRQDDAEMTEEQKAQAMGEALNISLEACRRLLGWELLDEQGRVISGKEERMDKLTRELRRRSLPVISRLVWACYGSSADEADEAGLPEAEAEAATVPPTPTPTSTGTPGTETTS